MTLVLPQKGTNCCKCFICIDVGIHQCSIEGEESGPRAELDFIPMFFEYKGSWFVDLVRQLEVSEGVVRVIWHVIPNKLGSMVINGLAFPGFHYPSKYF